MTRFGFALDQRSGVGCHADTVACKQELGLFRTRVDFAQARAAYRWWLALARPASGDLRWPIWLFRPVKPVLAAYALPQDERARAARAAGSERLRADELADAVDWDPAEVWGPVAAAGDPSGPPGPAQPS